MNIKVLAAGFSLWVAASGVQAQTVYWTIQPTGLLTSATGTAGFQLGNNIPINPNPAGTVWVACEGNWLYFHRSASGAATPSPELNRMLAVAIATYKTGSRVRVSVERDAQNRCYTSQVFDQGS